MPDSKTIPRFEPEVVQAIAAKRGDLERTATTSLKSFEAYGVSLSSRYNKAEEYQLMVRMLEDVPALLRRSVEAIYCDSKAPLCFTVYLQSGDEEEGRVTAEHLASACSKDKGGHNGMTVYGPEFGFDLDPEWPGWDEE